MKILVTGAAGGVGAYVARDLLEHGHEVRALDLTAPPADLRGRVEMVYADISDRLSLLRAVEGCEAIAHLAAIPNPMHGKDLELFDPNVLGTQYVFAAAEAHGVTRVALASSCAALGLTFSKTAFDVDTLPIDEAHPLVPQDVYGLSKQVNELTAAAYSRRCGMATTCLRLNWVVDFNSEQMKWHRRMMERAHEWQSREFWHYIEVRDVARAFRLALENVESGHHAVFIVARDLTTHHPRRELIRRHYPNLEKFLDSNWDFDKYGFWDTRRAEELFGFVAQHFLRDIPEASV